MKIEEKIRDWYLSNRRYLPWRESNDPYQIWVSEIILQQTRVMQGLEYYHRFLDRFPDLESLARAEEAEVLKVWEGLGYYSRARNMHAAAKYVYHEKGGNFPASYSEMLELKGVGPYTAAAVASMAFSEPRAVVDGNVHRVLSRLFGIREAPGNYGKSSRILREAEKMLDREDPGIHNQALMELGALVCTPLNPDCPACPLTTDCVAYLQNKADELPLRARPATKRKRYFHYLVLLDNGSIWMGPRMGRDIWQGLYEFPMIETPDAVSAGTLVRSDAWSALIGKHSTPTSVSKPVKHILSHQEIRAVFYQIRGNGQLSLQGYEKIRMQELGRYPVSKLISNYLDKLRD